MEIENENNTIASKKEAYMKELQDMSQYAENETPQQDKKDMHIIDEILEDYNKNLCVQDQINKENLGIILQGYVGDGHIIKTREDIGEFSYTENPSKKMADLTSEQEWVKGKDIGHIYILVDVQHYTTIAGIGIIDGKYNEINAEQVKNRTDGTVYQKNNQTYVGIPEEAGIQDIYHNFANYFEERLEKIETNDEIEH